MPQITTLDSLRQSATRYERDLLIMPVTTAQATLQHMTGMPGLHGPVVLGQLEGDAQLAPYKSTRKADANFTIKPRQLDVHLGNCAYNFDPNDVWSTIYGSLVVQGEGLKNVDIARHIVMYVAGKLGRNLNMALWNAKRKADGDTTADLFDGFDTITEADITSQNIQETLGNLINLSTAITTDNAVSIFNDIYDAADDELQNQKVKIYCSRDVYTAYNRNYQKLNGALPYNNEFKKTALEGTDGLWEFCPLSSKKGSKFIHIAPQSNLVYGYGAGQNPGECVNIEKYSSWTLTLEAAMAFGVQFRSVSPETFMAVKLHTED